MFVQGPSPRLRLIDTTLPNSFWELQQSAYAADNFGFLRYENNIAVPSKSFLVAANGNIGIGTINPGFKLDVAGMVNTSTLLVNSDSPRIRLIDTTLPNSFWELQQSAFFPDNFGFLRYESNSAVAAKSFFIAPTGNVGVGVAAPANKLSVAGVVESTTGGFKFPDGTTQSSAAVTNIGTITGVTAGTGLAGGGTSGNVSLSADFSSVQKRVTGTCASGTAMALIGIDGTVGCNSVGGGGGSLTLPFSGTGVDTPPTVQGVFKVTDTANGPTNTGGGPPDPNTVPGAVVGVGTGTGIAAGVIGMATGGDGVGVVAINTATAANDVPVMVSWSQATSGKVNLFQGIANSPLAKGINLQFLVPTSRAIFSADIGPSESSTTVFAVDGSGSIHTNGSIDTVGQINANGAIHSNGTITSDAGMSTIGDIHASGTVFAAVKNFKIDDPLAPADKWLYHTSVESPDMMDIYNGVVVLDARGQAWVQMPDWFEALNMDFRYQLTAMGRPAPNLYIAREVQDNRFKISGGRPHGKVSWQVTGIRHDAWAKAHRSPVEQNKSAEERGKYMYPEGFGHSGQDKFAGAPQAAATDTASGGGSHR